MQSTNKIAAPLPPVSGIPLLGPIPNIIRYQGDYFLEEWKKHGDIYRISLATLEFVIVSHPDFAQHVLRDNARIYTKGGPLNDGIRDKIGNGLLLSEGDTWRRQRRMMQPQFHRQYLEGITDFMTEAIEAVMDKWDGLAVTGENQDVSKLFAEITMNVIMKTMFGSSIPSEKMREMSTALSYVLAYFLKDMVASRLPEWVPVPGRSEYHEALDAIDNFIYGIIKQRRENPAVSMDIVSMMIEMVDEETNEAMSDREIRDEVVTIFLAGYDTTALALAWGAYVLSQETALQEKLRVHVDAALENSIPRFEDLRNLGYARMVICEMLRLYPPAILIVRSATEEDIIGGYRIKAGQTVVVNPLAMHYHPSFWPNPEKFDPERFSPEAEKGRHQLAWIPFGAGQRQCIGRDFALMEATLILSRMMQRFRFAPALDKPAPKVGFSVTLAPKDGIWLKLEKR